ncbi:hypothetical protein ABTY98_00165 [Streptomyces sp. NPDC096040]
MEPHDAHLASATQQREVGDVRGRFEGHRARMGAAFDTLERMGHGTGA